MVCDISKASILTFLSEKLLVLAFLPNLMVKTEISLYNRSMSLPSGGGNRRKLELLTREDK